MSPSGRRSLRDALVAWCRGRQPGSRDTVLSTTRLWRPRRCEDSISPFRSVIQVDLRSVLAAVGRIRSGHRPLFCRLEADGVDGAPRPVQLTAGAALVQKGAVQPGPHPVLAPPGETPIDRRPIRGIDHAPVSLGEGYGQDDVVRFPQGRAQGRRTVDRAEAGVVRAPTGPRSLTRSCNWRTGRSATGNTRVTTGGPSRPSGASEASRAAVRGLATTPRARQSPM